MKKYILILTLMLITFGFTTGDAYASDAEIGSIYGHISYVEGNPKVIRTDKTQEDATVNLPVVPGDLIVTGAKSRCELQFDNGTVMRIGKKSRLKVVTVLAKSLTTRWKITTLELQHGKLYTINQSYNNERFQIITPNAAIKLKRNSISTIDFRGGKTLITCDRGKFDVMFGDEAKDLSKETVKKGKTYTVTSDHKLAAKGKRDIDFMAWNEYIDKNFKQLHYGVSKVPKKIYKYNKALVHWAEKWSSLVGEWVYDDLFGYVWKPADEIFAHAARPFFHAKFVNVGGQMFIVPTQQWGWAPAHLGTWVWMKWGWTWIPGSAFSRGSSFDYAMGSSYNPYAFGMYYPTLHYWIHNTYGDEELYYYYRSHGVRAWRAAYQKKFKKKVSAPSLKGLPRNIRTIVKRLNKAPVTSIKKRLGILTADMRKPLMTKTFKVKPITTTPKTLERATLAKNKPSIKTTKPTRATPVTLKNKMKLAALKKTSDSKKNARIYRDWNPDKRWALHRGVKVLYSSKSNEVVCPRLGLSSKTITAAKRSALRGGGFSNGRRGTYSGGGSSGVSSSGTTSSGTRGSGSSRGGSSGSRGSGSGPGGGGSAKTDK
ncbi:MAG: FecR domain-containing protein [bacterium]|nr:FecR domain-containing protein [bacterium]